MRYADMDKVCMLCNLIMTYSDLTNMNVFKIVFALIVKIKIMSEKK